MHFSIVNASGDTDNAVYLLNLLAKQGHTGTRIPYENVVANGLDWFFQLVGQNGSDQIIAVGGHGAMPLISGVLLPQSEKTKIEQPGNYTVYATTSWHNYRTTVMAGYDTGETRQAITAFMGLISLIVPFTKEVAEAIKNDYALQSRIFVNADSGIRNLTGGQVSATGYEFDFNNNWFMIDFQLPEKLYTTGLTPFGDFPIWEAILGIAVVVVAVLIGGVAAAIPGLIAGGIVLGGLLLYEWSTGQQKVMISRDDVWKGNQQLFLEGKITAEQFNYNNKLYEDGWKDGGGGDWLQYMKYIPLVIGGMIAISLVSALMPRK